MISEVPKVTCCLFFELFPSYSNVVIDTYSVSIFYKEEELLRDFNFLEVFIIELARCTLSGS
jgi:hypothetical protein